MSHQDHVRERLNSAYLGQALQWLLARAHWKSVSFRDDCTWTPRLLAAAALLWAWSDETSLGDRFFAARRLITHLFPAPAPLASSYQAFLKLLKRWTPTLILLLQSALRVRMRETLANQWTVSGYVVMGVDGSRIELPRTKSNEEAYSASRKRSGKKKRNRKKQRSTAHSKKANVPQMWVTTALHVGMGLPWDWRIGPANSSERAHALDMLDAMPDKALVTVDAGFVGYDFASAVLKSGRHLLVRVGSNVRLLRKLGFVRESAGTVYVWTDKAAKGREPPLVFRLVVAQGPKHPIYLITSIRNPKELSDRQIYDVYKKRWGIELFYRHLKQTFQRRRLKSTCAANAAVELEWSFVGLWGLGLAAAAEVAKTETPLSRLSMSGVLRAVRRLMRDYLHVSQRGRTLCQLFREALVDTYHRRNKQSRDYPRKKRYEPIGIPILALATARQIREARQIRAAA